MTVAMLMNNTVDSAKRALQMQKVSPTLRMGFSLAPLFPYLRRFIRKWYFMDALKLQYDMKVISSQWGMQAYKHIQISSFVSQYFWWNEIS